MIHSQNNLCDHHPLLAGVMTTAVKYELQVTYLLNNLH